MHLSSFMPSKEPQFKSLFVVKGPIPSYLLLFEANLLTILKA